MYSQNEPDIAILPLSDSPIILGNLIYRKTSPHLDNPGFGEVPRYPLLKRQGYRVLILEKELVFYKKR
jgi:hypothetical protein